MNTVFKTCKQMRTLHALPGGVQKPTIGGSSATHGEDFSGRNPLPRLNDLKGRTDICFEELGFPPSPKLRETQ
jgi:hypothetical protein